MTIDERIERLTEKHEALAQSVELIAALTQENSASIQKLVEKNFKNPELLGDEQQFNKDK